MLSAAASSSSASSHNHNHNYNHNNYSNNNLSFFSFGQNGPAPAAIPPASQAPLAQDLASSNYSFLPEVSFDDFQTSIASASGNLELTQFPSPTGEGGILDVQALGLGNMVEKPNAYRSGVAARAPVHHQYQQQADQQSLPIRTRTGPVFRRPSVSNRQTSISSTTSTASRSSESPRDQATIRARRQNQHPPITSNIAGAKQPRKPVGMGVFESPVQATSTANTGVRRRPSLSSSTEHLGFDTARSSVDNGGRYADTAHSMTASRAAKLKTLSQPPPPRISQTNAAADSALSMDQSSLAAPPRSPRNGKSGATTPASAKRMSVAPGHSAHHASGLGARTISPTDTQRLKRRSLMPDPQSVADLQLNSILTAPPPPIDRPASRSPSMLPRKTSTPSSQRTTPDPNRKSYSSVSVASLTSNNTVRTSTGSLQPRTAQSGPSRLPAPKSMNSIPAANEEDEDVPPVPAIPKAYESPKDSPAELTFLDKRKSNLGLDTSSLRSTSTGSLSGPSLQEKSKIHRKQSLRKPVPNTSEPDKKPQPERTQPVQARRNLKSMNLPPLTVGPLSMPTVNKIAKLQQNDVNQAERKLNSPPARQTAKTPSTPMTASKTTFFPKRKELAHYRSTSSVHQPNRQASPFADTSSAESTNGSVMKASVSPYLSSSVPKEAAFDQAYFKRSQTGSDLRKSEESSNNPAAHSKPSGPRAPRQPPKPIAKVTTKANTKSPIQQSSPEEPQTPSSMTTLRRKLSLSWKRSSSKTEKHPENAHAKHDAMPPPRIPISATTGSSIATVKTGSPSVPTKSATQQHEAARRKASSASLNANVQQHGRNKSDTTGASVAQGTGTRQVKIESGDGAASRPTGTSTSVMQKFLRSKASTNKMQHSELAFTADLDKDDLIAEEEMRKLGSRRKETELAAKTLDTLRKRATPKERVSPQDAIRIAILNIYERGEIIDYKDVFFCGTQNAQKVVGDLHSKAPNFGYDDDRGDYSIVVGDHLAYRYEIVDVLGKGSFGQVVRCIDHKTGVLVAVKIIRNKKRFHQQALVEVNILQKLREWDPKNRHSMVNFTHSFYFREHLCISTELLDMNLYEFIKANAFRGFSLKMIRRFTKQMLSSLNLLKQKKVIHCDLKPENILLRHPLHTELKVIDFGSSCFENEKVYTYIQSRFYRSPEVILGMSYGLPIDMWSLGCILAELYTGVPIFPGENEQEQLACIMEVFGPPEKHLIEKSTRKKLFFDSMGKPRLTVSSKGRRRRPSSKTLQQALKCDDEAFLDFIARCLRWDPDRRLKPEEAIRHEYITGQKMTHPAPRMATVREQSPIKRHNTISTPRPLPEPPAAAASMRVSSNIRPIKDAPGVFSISSSPVKTSPASTTHTRRPSGVYTIPPKRTNTIATTGIGAPIGSSLPRAAGRSVSAKQDLASAGATAAMASRRA
ncbi:hypothetical protein BD289DRAFT_460266 [Coniella lustricola]|uniref:Protein kinase domain-containing protein n=1 Tax=Coniella lustricola TaxID=2025994 RepID=A0A2T3AB03_9PEZI|nr:hypothetical protein BD289DRAFT_460266 [Coniella lustricola]